MAGTKSKNIPQLGEYFVPRDENALIELFGRDVSRRVIARFVKLQDEEYQRCIEVKKGRIYRTDKLLLDSYSRKIKEEEILDCKVLLAREEFGPLAQAHRIEPLKEAQRLRFRIP